MSTSVFAEITSRIGPEIGGNQPIGQFSVTSHLILSMQLDPPPSDPGDNDL